MHKTNHIRDRMETCEAGILHGPFPTRLLRLGGGNIVKPWSAIEESRDLVAHSG